jgi:tRNA(adenine34) deaminase
MHEALAAAGDAAAAGDVPVGAIVVRGDAMIAQASNRTVRDQDPTAHAETLAIREAARALGRWRLDDCTLVVTLEPCAMCSGAAVLARMRRVVVGDLLRHPRLNHRPEVVAGVLRDECGQILSEFFRSRRSVDHPFSPD